MAHLSMHQPPVCRKLLFCLSLFAMTLHPLQKAAADQSAIGQYGCNGDGLWLQVLGSGGPEADDGRASTAYLVWQDGAARVLVDLGSGALLRLEQSGADLSDLDVLLFSHFHTDHSSDLDGLIKASYFTRRSRDLPLYGPTGNHLVPPASAFVQALLGPRGAYSYLEDFLNGGESYRLVPHDVEASGRQSQTITLQTGLTVTAVPVRHGPIPALAWRVNLGDKTLVFSGDMSGRNETLAALAMGADLLVAHNAIPENATGAARNLHMAPSVIGAIAGQAGVRQLVLSHRMNRSLGREEETLAEIRRAYSGPVVFADDLQCFKP